MKKTTATVISGKGTRKLDWLNAMENAQGRCEATPQFSDRGGHPIRCPNPAREAVEEVSPQGTRRYAMCSACRRAGVGPSSAEKAVATKAFKARQLGLFAGAE